MPSRLPFPAYQGTDPYLFVSYAHADSAVVYPEMEWLHGLGHRIWYDEGIEIGSEWTEAIAQAIDNCAQFLVFTSPQAVASKHVREEILHAFKREKTILCVYLQPTELPPGLDMRLGPFQAIHMHDLPVEEYRGKLRRALVEESRSASGSERQVPAPPKPAPRLVPPPDAPTKPSAPASPRKQTKVVWWWTLAVGVLAIAGILLGVLQPWKSKEGPEGDEKLLPSPSTPVPATTKTPPPKPPATVDPMLAAVTKEQPFVNSLGMKFVPVPGTDILMSIWETRVQDYAEYAKANPGVDMSWKEVEFGGQKQTADHPTADHN